MNRKKFLNPRTLEINPFESIRNTTTPISIRSPLVNPPRAQKTRWTKEELNLLLELISCAYPLDIIKPYFPLRSNGAVTKQAQRCGYRSQTDIYGNIIFEKGITSRKRGTIATGITEVLTIKENSEKVSNAIVAENEPAKKSLLRSAKINPNSKAMNMLRRASLPFDPDVVCTLTKHIIATQADSA